MRTPGGRAVRQRNSQCSSPELGVGLVCSLKAHVAGAEGEENMNRDMDRELVCKKLSTAFCA